jgi:hypothetical protein
MPVTRYDMPSGQSIYYKDGPEYHESQRHTYWTGYDETTGKCSGRVGGISTIAKVGNGDGSSADGLIGWGIKLHKQGIDYRESRDKSMHIGNLAHAVLEQLCEGVEPATATGHQEAVVGWWKATRPTPLYAEAVVYDHKYGFAGRFDLLYGEHAPTLLDLKTGSIRSEAFVQLNLYRLAMRSSGYPVPQRLVLLDTAEDGTWREIDVPVRPEWADAALYVYRNGKDISKHIREALKQPRIAAEIARA